MENYIKISTLNDFIFCPRSIYFHELYAKYNTKNYHQKAQTVGKHNHENIDKAKYSTSKDMLQWISVFSNKYLLTGKIDLFNSATKTLIERKNKIIKIYQGYIWQVYAQYFCMLEMWYQIDKIKIYSLQDNKNYDIIIPWEHEIQDFEKLIYDFHNFRLDDSFEQNYKKCEKCIYNELCDYYK